MSARDTALERRVLGQGRILEALPDEDAALTGTLDRLAEQFELTPDDFRTCLREMVQAGWVAVQTQPFRRLTVRLERRTQDSGPVARERRRSGSNTWPL